MHVGLAKAHNPSLGSGVVSPGHQSHCKSSVTKRAHTECECGPSMTVKQHARAELPIEGSELGL